MKTLIITVVILFSANVLIAQTGRTLYRVCGGGNQYVEFERDSVNVKTMTSELIVFESNSAYTHSAKKVAGFDLMEGGKDPLNIDRFYAIRVDENSFALLQKGGMHTGFSYFHADKRLANASDKTVRCAWDQLVRFESVVDVYLKQKEEKKKADEKTRTPQIITDWVAGLRSQRNDPALERDIRKWWQGPDPANKPDPILRIVFLQPTYSIERNQYGEVLRKHVDTLILWTSKDRSNCHIQWRSFGYDSLGAGTFSDEVQGFIKREYFEHSFGKSIRLTGGVEVRAGAHYEVNCSPFAT